MHEGVEELTDEQVAELRSELEAARDELARLLASSKESSETVKLDEPIGRLTRMDAMQQQRMAAEERRRREIRRRQVGAALKAIHDGEYGYCRKCEEPIGYDRLKARPETPFCVPCMERLERR